VQRVIGIGPLDLVEYADWSPDGSRLAIVANNQLVVRDVARGVTSRVTGTLPFGSPIAWTPDGSRVAYLAFDGVHVIDVSAGRDTHLTGTSESEGLPPRQTSGFGRPTWSPDGLEVLYAAQGQAYVARVDGSGAHRLTPVIQSFTVA
jgi:Tol biopolymer transport system component